jgi:hypothetical protein
MNEESNSANKTQSDGGKDALENDESHVSFEKGIRKVGSIMNCV